MKQKKIVIKVGTNVITQNLRLDLSAIAKIVEQIVILHQEGYQIVLVSSGAIAAGREVMPVQNYPPQELIQKVASKGGTTEAALQYLRQHKTDLTFQEALRRAYRRAQDLSK